MMKSKIGIDSEKKRVLNQPINPSVQLHLHLFDHLFLLVQALRQLRRGATGVRVQTNITWKVTGQQSQRQRVRS